MSSHEHAHSISRRSLLRGAIGAASTFAAMGGIQLLPKVGSGFLAPVSDIAGPRNAYAEELVFSIDVVGVSQVGIYVVDVSDDTKPPVPVGDATVTITSRFGKKNTVSGKTGNDPNDKDHYGKVILDIDKLAELDDNGKLANDGYYAFNGSVVVEGPLKDGKPTMRKFKVKKMRIEGATALQVNAHALDTQQVYPEHVSFDDWDALYNSYTYFRSNLNDRPHTFEIALTGATGNVPVTLAARDNPDWPVKGGLNEDATYDPETKLATARFTRNWLNPDNSYCPTSDSVFLRFTYPYNDKPWYTDIEFKTQEAPIESIVDNNPLLDPLIAGRNTNLSFTFPTGAPKVFSKASFSVCKPDFPIQVSATPTSAMIGFTTAGVIPKDDDGKDGDAAKADAPKEPFTTRIKDYFKNSGKQLMAMVKDHRFVDPESGELVKDHLSRNFDLNVAIQAVGQLDWEELIKDPDGRYINHFYTGLVVGALIYLTADFTEQAFAGPVPLFVSISFSIQTQVGMSLNGAYELYLDDKEHAHRLDLKDATWNVAAADPVVINLQIAFTLSVGAGIKGLACLAISGTVTLNTYFALAMPGLFPEKKANPHVSAGASAVCEIYVQALVFRGSVIIWSADERTLLDNWEPGDEMEEAQNAWRAHTPRFRLIQEDGSVRHSAEIDPQNGNTIRGSEYLYDTSLLQIVPESDLDMSKEFTGTELPAPVQTIPDYVKPVMHRNMALERIMQPDGTYALMLVPCEGVNSFTRSADIPVFGQGDEQIEAAANTDEIEMESDASDTKSSDPNKGSANSEDAPTNDVEEVPANDGDEGSGKAVAGKTQAVVSAEVANANDSMTEEDYGAKAGSEAQKVDRTNEGNGSEAENVTTTQSDDDLPGDPFLGFADPVMREFEYEAEEGKTTFNECGPLGIKACIANNGGVVPSTDVVICEEVFSDPRQRIVTVNGVPYLFRIASVKYRYFPNNVWRTRLTYARFDGTKWGEPTVIEYNVDDNKPANDPTKLKRIQLFDYDFDVLVRPSDATWFKGATVCIVLTGGTRPKGDQSTLDDVLANPTITVLFLDGSFNMVVRSVRLASDLLGNNRAHMVCTPHVVDHFSEDGASGFVAYSFLHRSADSSSKLMTNDADVSFAVGCCTIVEDGTSFQTYVGDSISLDKEAFDLKLAVESGGYSLGIGRRLSLLVMYPTGYDVYSVATPAGLGLDHMIVQRCVHNRTDALPEVVPWPGHGSFLYTKPIPLEGMEDTGAAGGCQIFEGTFDSTGVDADGFTENPLSFKGFKGGAFSLSPAGTYLFFIDERDGWAGDDIDLKTGKRTPVTKDIHRIRAAKFMRELNAFSEDFPFCELDHPIDSLESMTFDNEASSFICAQVDGEKGAQHSLAKIHYISVPHSKVAEVTGFEVADNFALAGKPCMFNVTLENHGNVAIIGFDLTLKDSMDNDKVLQTVTVDVLDPNSMVAGALSYDWAYAQANPDARADELHRLSDPLENGVMVPGTPMTYKVTFDIPDSWSGTHDVKVSVSNAKTGDLGIGDDEIVAESARLFVQAEDDHVLANQYGLATYYHPGKDGSIVIHEAEGTGTYVNPNEGVLSNGENEAKAGENGKNAGGSKPTSQTGGAQRSPLAYTGDGSSASGPAALALGGLGALFMGYSKRRESLEREDDE